MKKREEKKWSPEGGPVTPYQKAQAEWDNRMGAAVVREANWRKATFAVLALLGFCIYGLIYLGSQPKTVPHIVEVNKQTGESFYLGATGSSWDDWSPDDANKRFHIERFLLASREILGDNQVMKDRWIAAYNLVTPVAAAKLTEYVTTNDPFARATKERIKIDVKAMVPLSSKSWQIDWKETTRNVKGKMIGKPQMWRVVITFKLEKPETEAQLRANPIGLYIEDFNWTKIAR